MADSRSVEMPWGLSPWQAALLRLQREFDQTPRGAPATRGRATRRVRRTARPALTRQGNRGQADPWERRAPVERVGG